MRYLAVLLLLSGCVSKPMFVHIWCHSKDSSFGIWTEGDGKYILAHNSGYCEYVKTENVKIKEQK